VGPATADFSLAGCEQVPPVAIDMWQSPAEVSQALKGVDMDHAIPKTLICEAGRKCIAKHGNHDFKRICNVGYLNHLLFSVKPHRQWVPPWWFPGAAAIATPAPPNKPGFWEAPWMKGFK
jgi:hypothetical protein